jgi:hypothetical protein
MQGRRLTELAKRATAKPRMQLRCPPWPPLRCVGTSKITGRSAHHAGVFSKRPLAQATRTVRCVHDQISVIGSVLVSGENGQPNEGEAVEAVVAAKCLRAATADGHFHLSFVSVKRCLAANYRQLETSARALIK